MSFRAVIHGIGYKISNHWVENKGNWFIVNGRAYRKDRKAICKVIEKDGRLKGVVEAHYIEGDPIPFRSTLKPEDITVDHLEELIAVSTNEPKKSFLDILFRR